MNTAGGRILVIGDEGTGSLAAVRALRRAGFEVWVGVGRGDRYAARSRAATGVLRLDDPHDDPAAFVEAVSEHCARLGLAAVLPGTEAALRALVDRDRLGGAAVGSATRAVLDRATDRLLFVDLCRAAGIETPETLVMEDGIPPSGAIPYPAVVKPLRTVEDGPTGKMRTRRVRFVRSREGLEQASSELELPRLIVQPHIEGALGAIAGVAWSGRLVSAVHQVAMRIWPPDCGISCYAVTVPPDPELERRVARLLELIGWSGIYQVQFIRSGRHAFAIDFNPRIYGSMGLAVSAGHNLPAIWTQLLLGRRPSVAPYRVGMRYRAGERDLGALWTAARQGQIAEAISGLVPRPRTTHSVFSLRDPAPSLVSARRMLSRLARA